MGKQAGKKKKQVGTNSGDSNVKQSKVVENTPRVYDNDTAVFITMSQEHKEEGNKLFQKKDYEGAILKYEKALKLLPANHIDVSHLHSNMAACFMQMGLSDYPRAIHECNLALEVTPTYSKALLKRARCYEALNRLELAFRDVSTVLKMEPNNIMATEIAERVKTTIEKKGTTMSEAEINSIPVPEYVEVASHPASPPTKLMKERGKKKKSNKIEKKIEEKSVDIEKKDEEQIEEKKDKEKVEEKRLKKNLERKSNKKEKKIKVKNEDKKKKGEDEVESKRDEGKIVKHYEDNTEEKKAEDKAVVEEEPKRNVKLVLGEDIRWAKIPVNCSILKLREIIRERFPNSEAVLIKYRDQEGDLVTITTSEELRWAEACEQQGSVKLYIVDVNPEQEPLFEKVRTEEMRRKLDKKVNNIVEDGNEVALACIDDWIIQFAQLFKNYVGFNSDAYLDLHKVGMKLYSEAMEDTVTSEEAQDLFNAAADKFQEMAALALFNWGNVHMSKARKRVYFTEDASRVSVLEQVKVSYDWAQKEYSKAREKYEEALKIKPDFYEGVIALGQGQFEQAKLSWYYAVGNNVDLETWDSTQVLQLYNCAEDNMEKGMQMWEEAEKQRITEFSSPSKVKVLLQKMDLDRLIKDITASEAAEQAANMKAQIYLLWGTLLYERSIMEYKLGLPVWHECLEVSIEKFELCGASPTDIAVMIKNHCSNDTAVEGVGFNIDEIIQAWNEMYEAKRWQSGVPSFRLEPLLRRRVSKLYHALELA